MGTLLFILLLLILCGFIAYVGDLLGRRLGKKRLTVFGLRPKHTAILLTIVTGVLIALVTFGAALASIPWFRQVVVQGERLAGQNQRLAAANAVMAGQNRELERQSGELTQQRNRLAGQNRQLLADNSRLEGGNRRLAAGNARLTRENRGLAEQSRALREQNASLGSANGLLRAANTRLQRSSDRLERETARLQVERGRLTGQVTSLTRRVRDLGEIATQYRAEQFLFRKGQEICRRPPFPAVPPVELLREGLKALMAEAEQQAREAYQRLQGGLPPALVLTADGYQGTGRAAALERWAAQQAARLSRSLPPGPLLIRLVASENCIPGRPLPVELDYFGNDVVFRSGQVIGARAVDGAADRAIVFSELIYLLQSVGSSARRQGMVAAGDGVGEVGFRLMFEALDRVRRVNGPARVIARVKQDTRRAGPLNLDLEVNPVEEPRAAAP